MMDRDWFHAAPKRLRMIALALLLTFGGIVVGGSMVPNPDETAYYTRSILAGTVRVEMEKGRGSGTVIASRKENGRWATYVLTNRHVVQEETTAQVEWFRPGEFFSTTTKTADVIAVDAVRDLALLRIKDNVRAPSIAKLAARYDSVMRGEKVWAAGAGLGFEPFVTEGHLSVPFAASPTGSRHLVSAPIIFGNSGGGLYHMGKDGPEMIGVPHAILQTGGGFVATPIPHMALVIPIRDVHEFIEPFLAGAV